MMRPKKRINSSSNITIICEDNRLVFVANLLFKEMKNIIIIPCEKGFNSSNSYNLICDILGEDLDIKDYGKNGLLVIAEKLHNNKDKRSEKIFFLLDRDYSTKNFNNLLYLNYYSSENLYITHMKSIVECTIDTEIQKIKELFDKFDYHDTIYYSGDKILFRNEIHEQYYLYIKEHIICEKTFVQYIKVHKSFYKTYIDKTISDRDEKKKILALDKFFYTKKVPNTFVEAAKKNLSGLILDDISYSRISNI